MKMPRSLQTLGLPTGFVGLVRGVVLLDREPLFGVLVALGAMVLLLASLTRLCESSSTK